MTSMPMTQLGQTGLKVSKLAFGTMSFGGDADEAASAEMYKACRDKGINTFDCADAYSGGRAEEILGRLMAHERDDLIITSKCFMSLGGDINAQGGNRRYIPRAVEASLKRLGTDRIDVFFMHRWDASVPLEETLRALENLVQSGKILYLGVSNYAAWQIAKGLGISERHGWTRFDVIQPMYNLVKRQVEAEILPLVNAEKLGVMTYGPLGGGLLTGKYQKSAEGGTGRLASNKEYNARYGEPWVFDVAERFVGFAKERGLDPVKLAVAWAAWHPDVSCPLIGGRSLEQLRPSLDALDVPISDELRHEVSALTRQPAPATDRHEELAV